SVLQYPPLAFPEEVTAACLGADGRTLFTAGRDEALRRWDLAAGRELSPVPGPFGQVRALALSPDGKAVLTGGADGAALWDLAEGRQLLRFPHPEGGVNAVAFSPDGKAVL